jgi:outer membrane protein assembly factor BamB
VVALGLAGLAGYEWPHRVTAVATSPSTTAAAPSALQSFVTRPDLLPPIVRVTSYSSTAHTTPPFIFIAPRNYNTKAPGQAGLMILDRSGRLVWFKPITPQAPFDFNAQSYRGRPVLTWWQGKIVVDYGVGTAEMADSAYNFQQSLPAGHGIQADLHELTLTSAGTALVTAYHVVTTDLSSVGGQAKGQLVGGHAQEIDLATGKVLFDWDSTAHIALDESYVGVPKTGQYDYFHINSIAEAPDGNLLISARNTWAVYKIDRSTGKVLWRLNGKKSDFTMGPGSVFYWQHDARPHGPGTISVFDDGAPSEEQRSRGLVLAVDDKAMHVSLAHAYVHPAGFLAANQGNVQVLPDGRVFVGWGNQPYFSEFATDGTLLLDGEMPIGYRSYRALCHDWGGKPTEPPAVAARSNPAGGTVAYASWNGATDVYSWNVLAGKESTSLEVVGSQLSSGFESAIAVNSSAPYFAVVAMSSRGKELGRSPMTNVGA